MKLLFFTTHRWWLWHAMFCNYYPENGERWKKDGEDAVCGGCGYRIKGAGHEVNVKGSRD